MIGYLGSIDDAAKKNNNFRQILFTSAHMQLILMSLLPKEEIGNEMHDTVDQFFHVEMGEAKFVFNDKEEHIVVAGDAMIVPAGTYHNVINTSSTKPLKLYTIFAPPNLRDGIIHQTRADAESGNEPFIGKTTKL